MEVREQLLFLEGGGEMGARMRAFNWNKHPLGPPETWPDPLKTSLSICLNSRFPMVIWWGPDLYLLYNDAWRPILGSNKDRVALGSPGRDVWPEIWDVIGPMFAHVFSTGQATWSDDGLLMVNRYGYTEEAFFTWSYSPIRDQTGEVCGVFTAVTETTERVLGERRLRTLQEMAVRSTQAKSLEEACRHALEVLANNQKDVPFSFLYKVDDSARQTRLINPRIGPDLACAPNLIALDNGGSMWPLQLVVASGETQILSNLSSRFDDLPRGAWEEPPDAALLLPIILPGHSTPDAILIAGKSPHSSLDKAYRDFYERLRTQLNASFADALAYEQERKRNEALAELDRAKTTFFSNISHELRTPLTLILGPLEDELKRSGDNQPQIELAYRNSLRLLKLVNSLLDFSRIEAGRIEAKYASTDLAEYTAELASIFRSAVERAGLCLIVECPPLPQLIYVDREMWEKIVLNLLSNALKFTFKGHIKVTLAWRDDVVELSVSDTGVGISKEALPRLFQRFERFRAARSRTHEGTGIGLALVQELAALHGGEASVQSEEGVGSTFRVTIKTGRDHLPIDRIVSTGPEENPKTAAVSFVNEALRWLANEDAPPISTQKAEDHSLSRDGARPRILLADDNADMRAYISRILGKHFDVIPVPDGALALEHIHRHPPDLLLTDVMMPGLDGFELLQQIRSNTTTRTLPVIMVSARAGEESRVSGLEAGADDYLVKPFSAGELLAKVRSHLELSRFRRETEQRLTGILESITDGLMMMDAQWRITFVNKAAIQILASQGVDPRQIIGKHYFDEVFPQTRGTLVEHHFRRAMAERVPVFFETYYEPWSRWFSLRVYPVENGGITIYFQDITERKATEEALQRAQAELQRTNEELEQRVIDRTAKLREALGDLEAFSYSIAHDMRAPLRAMRGFAGILCADYAEDLDATAKDFLQRIATSSERLDRLIQDVLDYSKVVRGEFPREIVNTSMIVREVIDSYPQLNALKTHIHAVEPLHPAFGNAAALTQVISNLLSNAIKFVPEGVTPKVIVRSELVDSGEKVRFWVEDNGIGIDPEAQKRLFGVFHRLHRPELYDGTGIGLAIVRKAVERMGGQVGVISEPGKGSRFWFQLKTPYPSQQTIITPVA